IRVSAALTRIGEPGAGNVLASTGTQVVLLSGASTVVEGNLIGLLPDGVTAVGAETGVEVRSIASAARIGGTAPGAGNTIAGHTREGIETDANDTTIQGNTVGLNAAGAAAPNEDGIAVTADADDTLIGGTTPGARNIVSGNGRDGIAVEAGANTTIQGNWIGVGADGTSPRPNGGDGVYLDLFDPAVVGGVDPGAGNVIAHNGGDGIATDDTDDPALVLGNAI